jgi:hypothetical protein
MAKLSNSSLLLLAVTILVYFLARYGLNFSTDILLVLIIMAVLTYIILFFEKNLGEKIQFLPILLGFVGGVLLNNILSASYLADFTEWLIQTNTGAFNYNFQNNLFISLLVVVVIILIFVLVPLKSISRIERAILIFFGFWVGSLILAGINFTSLLNDYLHLLPVATHWGDQVRIDAGIIVDVLKSLFLAGLFNVLERIARMRREI